MDEQLSDNAKTVLKDVYKAFREHPEVITDYEGITKALPLTLSEVEEVGTELKVCGYVKLVETFNGNEKTGLVIQDEGKIAALRLAKVNQSGTKTSGWARTLSRAPRWIGSQPLITAIVATVIGGIILAWVGLR